MNDKSVKGITTEMHCQLFFLEQGYNVYTPVSPDTRIDFIAEIEGTLIRIQVKSSHEVATGIEFSTTSSWVNTKEVIQKGYTKEEIDFFATYYNGKVYLIPVEICGKRDKILSFEPNSFSPYTLLEDYEAEKILKKYLEGYDFQIDNKDGKKKVAQYDLNNNFIHEYDSLSDAARGIGKPYGLAHISAVANGKRKTAYGYIWKLI